MKKLMLIAALLPGMALAEITGSAHDFNNNPRALANDGQICRYCHIPHGARAQSFIWSHVASSQVYTWGTGTQKTQAGWTLQSNLATNGSWSAGCLDCHDGSVAVGALYNGVTETFSGAAIDAQGRLQGLAKITKTTTNNLNGNHPVSVPYPKTAAGATFRGQAIPSYTAEYIAEYVAPDVNGVVGALSLAKDYTAGGTMGVECSTCHDPHNGENLSYLLRVTHTGSAICLNCHIK